MIKQVKQQTIFLVTRSTEALLELKMLISYFVVIFYCEMYYWHLCMISVEQLVDP